MPRDPSAPLPALYFKTVAECQKSCDSNLLCQWFSYKADSYPTNGACYIFTKTDVAKEADPKAFSGPKGCQETTILTDAATAAAGVASNLQEGATGAAADMQTAVNGQVNAVTGAAADAQNAATAQLNGLQEGATGAAADMQNAVNGQVNAVTGAAADAQNAVTGQLNGLQEGATGAAADMQNAVNGHLNSLQDGANGAVNSISNAFSSAGAQLTGTANKAADQVGATFKGEGADGKAMAAGSQSQDNTALYAIVGGGVGAALVAAGAFAMMGDGSEKKPKKKRGVPASTGSKKPTPDATVDAEAPSASASGLQMATPTYSVPRPTYSETANYGQPASPSKVLGWLGVRSYQQPAYQPMAYQPASYQQMAMPAAQPMTYQAAPAYQPASMAASAYQPVMYQQVATEPTSYPGYQMQ
ncbi:unnamed protein product [Effrenium voratum]|uniref:Apple domain-containing protein n=1 Tax=Effrenium voratum TaxID=2562239 RepID=A0AA36ILZ1_9DINO|nr:unnamed protein product [Effrenium voratum]